MSRWSRPVLSAVASTLALSAVAASPKALDSLIQSERQFSATSVAKGMKAAFLTYLADDGVIFRPLPLEGKKLWASRDSVPGTLVWEPSYAEVAASGDLGYTTGPWEYRPPAGGQDSTRSFGHFISVWRKQSDGTWRVVVDIGIQHDKPERGVGSGDLITGSASSGKGKKNAEPSEVAVLDRWLSEATFTDGMAKAFLDQGARDLRLNRDGFFPSLGRTPVNAAFDSVKGGLRFESRGSGFAASRDLAYSYGVSRWSPDEATAPSDSGVYLHVWRNGTGKKWELALAVENPL